MRPCRVSCVLSFLIVFTACVCILATGFGDNDGTKGGGRDGAGRSELDVYLCLDSENIGNGRYTPMVYTYINGQRTECMSRHEFDRRFRSVEALPLPPSSEATPRPLEGHDYRGMDFSENDMYAMDLRYAKLCNANFFRADMRKINLSNADCRGASFEGAFIKDANLSGADLTNTILKGAYFVGCDLSGTSGLESENLMRVNCLYNCRLDEEIYQIVLRNFPGKLRDISQNWGVEELERRLKKK